MFKKIICLLLGIIMVLSVTACGGNGGKKDPNANEDVTHETNTGIEETVTETDTYFFKDGVSEWKIVVPTNETSPIKEATNELKYFIKDANGFNMEVITDEGLTFNSNDKYISLGNTTIAQGAGLTATEEEVGWDGFKIKTYGNTVVMVSSSDNGIINAVYGFLQRVLDYHYYADDEWVIDKNPDVKFLEMEIKEKPTFSGRWIDFEGNGQRHSNDYDAVRWWLRTRQTGGQGSSAVGRIADWSNTNDQSMETQIWSNKYAVGVTQVNTQTGERVPWTNDDGGHDAGQICLATLLDGLNGAYGDDLMGKNEAFTSFAVEMVNKYFAVETDRRIYFLGINDNRNKCLCKECMAYYGAINEAGQFVKLSNELNKVFKKWLNNEYNGVTFTFENPSKYGSYQFVDSPVGDENRSYMIGFFSYLYTINPPCNWDKDLQDYVVADDVRTVYKNGKWTTESLGVPLLCDDEVMVRIAPIEDVNMYPHMDEKINPLGHKSFSAWAKCTQHLTVWDYGTNFNAYLAPYPDWGTLQENFIMYEEKGVLDVFTQLAAHTDGVAWNRMMVYLRTQLMWNVHQDMEALITDFMNHYYKDAAPYMRDYFDYVRAEFNTMKLVGGHVVAGSYDGYIYGKKPYENWKYEQLLIMKDYFDRAFAQLEQIKVAKPEEYAIAHKRLTTESLFYRYVIIDRFSSYYPKTVVADMIDSFEIDAANARLISVGRLVGQPQGGTADRLDVIIPIWRATKI